MRASPLPDAAGMRDFFDVYAVHEPELQKHLLAVCEEIPALAAMLKRMTPQQLEQQREESLRVLRLAALEGNWEPLLASQRAQGPVYATMGIPFRDWFELVGAFEKIIVPHLVAAHGKDPARLSRVLVALSEYLDLSMSSIGEEYLRAKERIISQQAESIQELSTPVLQVRDRLLLIPIVGVLDTHRARALTQALLHAVRDHRAKVAVIDITGVPAVDSKVANHLFQTVAAVKLMGAHTIVTGLSADVAQALVVLGIDVDKLNTAGDLQGGLEAAASLLGDAPPTRSPDVRPHPQAS